MEEEIMIRILLAGNAAVFGIVIGSFLNVCIYRIPQKISVVSGNKGRSMCPDCGHGLTWYDLVPVISYLFLKGKCRYCRRSISFRYPMVECLNGILWALVVWEYQLTAQTVIYCMLSSILIVVAYIDKDTQEIPYRLQAAIAILGLGSLFFEGFPGLQQRVIGMLIIALPMAVGAVFGAFGGGDVQLVFVSGFLVGWKIIVVAAFLSIILGGIFGIIEWKKGGSKKMMAFGPYLSIGIVVAVLWGEQIFNWYVSFF